MRIPLIFATIFLILVTSSCGQINPTLTPVPPSPALFPGAKTGAAQGSNFLAETAYGQNIRFEQFSLEEGLSQSVVNVILQDRKGFLWIGTEDGLNRYDGYQFKVYKPDPDNATSLSDRWITALAEDPNGYLWIGTRLGGLNRYDPQTGQFTHYLHSATAPNSISHNHVTSLGPDKNGIWVGTEDGLDFLSYSSMKVDHFRATSESANAPSSNWITSLALDPNGNVWIGTQDAGLNFYNKTKKAFTLFKHAEDTFTSITSNRILSILWDRGNHLWIGTANGLNYSETGGQYFSHYTNNPDDKDTISGNTIYTVYQDHSNGIWIGTNNGLNRFDEHRGKFFRHEHQPAISNSLANNNVYAICEDNTFVLWVGTNGGGLNKYNRQQDYFSYYRTDPDDSNSLSGNIVNPIVIGDSGTAWIGTNDSGLNRFNAIANQFRRYEHDPNNDNTVNSNEIVSLLLDSRGQLWIGTARGLDRLDPDSGKFTHFFPDANNPGSLSGAPVYSIYEDHTGAIWVGTSRGLDQYEPLSQTFIYYEADQNISNSFRNNQVTAILEDQSFNFWVGTFDDGLKYFNPNTSEIISYVNNPDDLTSLGSNSIVSLYKDRQGTLWVGTAGGGLNRYEPSTNTFTRFTEKDGLPNNVIYGILEDSAGDLWLSTNFGIARYDPNTKSFRNFTSRDGLQSNEFKQGAFAKDKQGDLYFGGINGFNIFSPNKIKDNPIAPKIVLTSLTHDGRSISGAATPESLKEITLRWPQNSFEFEFAALAYGQPGKNQYAYTLENFESNWNRIGTQRNGRYTNLPGGTYTLRLIGSNSDGVWNDVGLSVKITVIPPFWVTWWFRSLLLVLSGVVIAGGYRWRVKSIEGRNRELARLVQRRTSDLEKRTSEIEALYQADERILRNVTLIQVFQTLVDVSVSMLKADRSVVFAWSPENNKILPRVSHGFRPETLNALNFEEGEGLVGQTMLTGTAVIVLDVKLELLRGDIQTVIRREGIQSFAHFPISVDGVVIAVFNVAYTRPNALNDETVRLFSALVTRAALSIANMQLFEQTKDLAVMEERNRLARDLHDSAKQKAFAALAQLGTINGILTIKPEAVQAHLNEAETLVYEVIQELTFLIQEIYPIALQEKGLPTTLREYIFEWESRNDAVVNLTVQNERRLPLDVEQAIYRLIQEALANVSRHSKAKRVDVSLVYNVESLQATIADDGCGFDMNQKAKGMGFRSMRERIGGIRGTIQIQSAPGQGTRVIAQLPIKGEDRSNRT